MKPRYRLFRRRQSVYYAFDNQTKQYESLRTKDEEHARRLVGAMNEASKQSAMNLQLAHVYFRYSDPAFGTRTWQHVMDEGAKLKKGETHARWERAMREKPFDAIRHLLLLKTTAEDLIAVLARGTISTNIFLLFISTQDSFRLKACWLFCSESF